MRAPARSLPPSWPPGYAPEPPSAYDSTGVSSSILRSTRHSMRGLSTYRSCPNCPQNGSATCSPTPDAPPCSTAPGWACSPPPNCPRKTQNGSRTCRSCPSPPSPRPRSTRSPRTPPQHPLFCPDTRRSLTTPPIFFSPQALPAGPKAWPSATAPSTTGCAGSSHKSRSPPVTGYSTKPPSRLMCTCGNCTGRFRKAQRSLSPPPKGTATPNI